MNSDYTTPAPSPLDYFSDEEVPFGDSPNTFAYIAFDFATMTFALNIKQNGDDEYLGGDDQDDLYWGERASEESVEEFIKEVCEEYGVEKFPERLKRKAITFMWNRQYTESFNVPVTKTSAGSPDMIKVLYFKGVPEVYSNYLSVERGGKSFAGPLEDKEMLTGAVTVLNDTLQEATETDAIANTFCLLAEIGRQVPGGEETYRWGGLLIPYSHPRPRLVEELLIGDGEIKPPHLPRVPDRRI